MSPFMIMTAIQAIESLTMMVSKMIQDHATMSNTDKVDLLARIKQIQASVPEWK